MVKYLDIFESKIVNTKKIIRYTFYTLFILSFVWVCAQLFFERETDNILVSVKNIFGSSQETSTLTHLKVIYPDDALSLEPTLLDPASRQRLSNIYEPLVKTDRDLNLQPSLAVSWGIIDDKTWIFSLRPGVTFHDGSAFDAGDAAASIRRAILYSGSELTSMLDSIDLEGVDVINDLTIRITTTVPDPLLLHKLSNVLVIPQEYEKEEDFKPVGTGSYKLNSWTFGDKLKLKRFDNYWGRNSKFEEVEMIVRLNKSERVNMFLNGEAQLLAFLPFDAVSAVAEKGFQITSIPSLEVQFLLFNMQSGYFDDIRNREVFSLAIDQDALTQAVGGYAKIVSQFVSNGIFGFNPEIESHEYDLEKAKKLARETGLVGKTIYFHLPKGLDVLGEHVRQQLGTIDVYVVVSYMEMDKLWESIKNSSADLYFFGFKSDLGDSADFLNVVVNSDGTFNVGNYSNSQVDEMIDLSLVSMDPVIRLENLQEAMRIIVEEDIIGVPLFEYETLYSFVDAIDIEPRIDGLIYFDEIITK